VALFDMPLDELRGYAPKLGEPADFDAFWAETLASSPAAEPVFTPVETGLRLVTTYDVTFAGFGGHPIKAWFTVPADADGPLPTVVQYQGYNGGRGVPHQHLVWASAGYAHLMMDTRGQGSGWMTGDTDDPAGTGPSFEGFMTRGITDPQTYYYRRVFADAVRAVDAALAHPLTDPDRVYVTGTSQGGGITLAVAGLRPGLAGVLPDVPFLCHYERAIEITDEHPYAEIRKYLSIHRSHRGPALRTLGYFDGVSFAARADAPALFSTALMDEVCPPSTVFAAFNSYANPDREIVVYPDNQHEGGSFDHLTVQLEWIAARLAG
jgi:cephalosporin-C deacetylase